MKLAALLSLLTLLGLSAFLILGSYWAGMNTPLEPTPYYAPQQFQAMCRDKIVLVCWEHCYEVQMFPNRSQACRAYRLMWTPIPNGLE